MNFAILITGCSSGTSMQLRSCGVFWGVKIVEYGALNVEYEIVIEVFIPFT
jgi:hypothetical protein